MQKDLVITDHNIIHVICNNKEGGTITQTKQYRVKINYDSMVHILIDRGWVYSFTDADTVIDIFINNILSVLNVIATIKQVKNKHKPDFGESI